MLVLAACFPHSCFQAVDGAPHQVFRARACCSGVSSIFKPSEVPEDVMAFVAAHFPLFDTPEGLFEDVLGGTPAPRVLTPKDVRCVSVLYQPLQPIVTPSTPLYPTREVVWSLNLCFRHRMRCA